MKNITLRGATTIDADILVKQIVNASDRPQLLEFILALENHVYDEEFARDIVRNIAASLIKDGLAVDELVDDLLEVNRVIQDAPADLAQARELNK